MSKLGKLLFGCTVAGITAATVYYYLEENAKKAVDDFDNDEFDGEEESRSDKIRTAATRTYTTIKSGSADAVAKVKEAIGPRGEEVLDAVGDAAVKVKDAVKDSAVKVREILNEPETDNDEGVDSDDEKVPDEAVGETAADETPEDVPDSDGQTAPADNEETGGETGESTDEGADKPADDAAEADSEDDKPGLELTEQEIKDFNATADAMEDMSSEMADLERLEAAIEGLTGHKN